MNRASFLARIGSVFGALAFWRKPVAATTRACSYLFWEGDGLARGDRPAAQLVQLSMGPNVTCWLTEWLPGSRMFWRAPWLRHSDALTQAESDALRYAASLDIDGQGRGVVRFPTGLKLEGRFVPLPDE